MLSFNLNKETGTQLELFNPLIYITKRTYMLSSKAYAPWRKQENKKLREPFQRRQNEIIEEEKASHPFGNDRESCFKGGNEDE